MPTTKLTTIKPRLFWFSYHAPTWMHDSPADRQPYAYARALHEVRDAGAFAFVSSVILPLGYEFGGVLLNLDASQFEGVLADDPPEMQQNDILCLPTRPPLNDERPGRNVRGLKGIAGSGTDLEDSVFKTIRRLFFGHCSREQVRLNDRLADAVRRFGGGVARWVDVRFRQNRPGSQQKGSTVQNLNACYRPDWVKSAGKAELAGYTAGYFFVIPKLLNEGDYTAPRLLGLFGLGGPETLTLACLLATSLAPTLREFIRSPHPRLLIVQWPVPRAPSNQGSFPGAITLPLRPTSLDFLNNISPTVVLDAECIDERELRWVSKIGTKAKIGSKTKNRTNPIPGRD